MAGLLQKAGRFVGEFAARFRVTRETAPIDTVAEMRRFARTRAAFVGQKKLYEYLKTRIGTRYPTAFENEAFVASINIAKLHVCAGCLSDLTVHVVAKATAGSGLPHEIRAAEALSCFTEGVSEMAASGADAGMIEAWREAFGKRLGDLHWENAAIGHDAFSVSPKALVRWAPIADELKRQDAEIVRNSVRFAWNEVIRDFRERGDLARLAAAIAAENEALSKQ
ncbi:MAG: hypothetical protein KF849_17050 [Rhizobiaceae bacterium]|nr:hypothetical protein [Rhizobiaceae bacterium]